MIDDRRQGERREEKERVRRRMHARVDPDMLSSQPPTSCKKDTMRSL